MPGGHEHRTPPLRVRVRGGALGSTRHIHGKAGDKRSSHPEQLDRATRLPKGSMNPSLGLCTPLALRPP